MDMSLCQRGRRSSTNQTVRQHSIHATCHMLCCLMICSVLERLPSHVPLER